jgi:hypothetical protein
MKNEINASPLELLSPGETQAMLSQQQEIEKQQITMLWQVALKKSPDFQLILKKLIPSGDEAKTLKLIDALITQLGTTTGVSSDGSHIGPSFGPYAGDYSTPVLHYSHYYNFSKVFDNQEFIENKKVRISNTERHNFYESARETAKNVIGHYRDYKIQHKKLVSANEDFEGLKKIVADAKNTDAAKQIEVQYSLKKQQGEIEEIGKELARFRSLLSEQTSDDAVRNLDESIQTESQEISAESDQLQALFEAALQNSPDINFVLAKLAPNADLSKTATILMKQIGHPALALTNPQLEPDYPQIANANKIPSYKLPAAGSNFGIAGRNGTASDPTYVTQNLNFNVFSQIIDKAENNRATKAPISQAEQVMLYNMLRNTGKQVIADYREYKIQRKKQFSAKTDFDETLLNKYRQHLIDLAGSDAVDNLDQQLDAEFKTSAHH